MREKARDSLEVKHDPRDVAELIKHIEQEFLEWMQAQREKYGVLVDRGSTRKR
jgi:hypothetical protein